ncbi:zinc dependent phospholipase C family protein [Butyrivibrio proteoclasticus]|uniref:zinc dependent phospholipase C family protein n=1 Tax=Butyrivibrio proteoclasticus TaxID=43305 RepID=UPI00047EE930|nr:zinc dependent phospholipase C family protein [Butyrivibrio proteoclasticus]
MASWMVHLRIADNLLKSLEKLDKTAFVLGNIAPDSGIPNEDWTEYNPPRYVSHYNPDPESKDLIEIDRYLRDYFSAEKVKDYNLRQYSFFLGYFTHLLTDIEWTRAEHNDWGCDEFTAKRLGISFEKLIRAHKDDRYDLDYKYLKEHPDFDAFLTYERASDEDLDNDLMDEFPKNAFQDRRGYICGLYRSDYHGDLSREFKYLTQKNYDDFVEKVSSIILDRINKMHILIA